MLVTKFHSRDDLGLGAEVCLGELKLYQGTAYTNILDIHLIYEWKCFLISTPILIHWFISSLCLLSPAHDYTCTVHNVLHLLGCPLGPGQVTASRLKSPMSSSVCHFLSVFVSSPLAWKIPTSTWRLSSDTWRGIPTRPPKRNEIKFWILWVSFHGRIVKLMAKMKFKRLSTTTGGLTLLTW